MKTAGDKLILAGCKFQCLVGCAPEEQVTPQLIILDLELFFDMQPAARSDNLSDTIDYAAVHAAVKPFVEGKSFQLIETLAEDVAALILKNFPVQKVMVRVKKTGPLQRLGGDWAGVEITRP